MTTDPQPPAPAPAPSGRARSLRRAALVGALAAALCPVLFPAHHEMCRAIVNVCTGGLL